MNEFSGNQGCAFVVAPGRYLAFKHHGISATVFFPFSYGEEVFFKRFIQNENHE